jgi:hypothetical protein
LKTFASLALLGLLAVGAPAGAAENYDNCAGFVDSLPATISSQGVWCLRKDVATAMTAGAAITIDANNVTVDCNDFKMGGLAAGPSTSARGIYASGRQNLRIRNCNIRGFHTGLEISGAGHVVEDNLFNGNLSVGLSVSGDGSVVRRNVVLDTGGSTLPDHLLQATALVAVYNVDVIDNTIDGVMATGDGAGTRSAIGIRTQSNQSGTITGNRVRGILAGGLGTYTGIANLVSGRIALVDNVLSASAQSNGVGIRCTNAQGIAIRNIVNGFPTGIQDCTDSGGNVQRP